MKKKDYIQRFLFENQDIRGEIVHLDDSWKDILSHHTYPPLIRQYLGEIMAATVLLAATLKIDGSLIKDIDIDKNSHLVVETIVEFANKLGIEVIAEHVHSSTVMDKVKELGITYSQGFYIDEPTIDLKT